MPWIFIIEMEDCRNGEQRTFEVDFGRPSQIDIELHLSNEANPITPEEAAELARLLGVEPTPQFRLEVHEAISGTLMLLERGWRGPRWLLAVLKPLTKVPSLRAWAGRTREAFRGVIKRGEPGDEIRAMLLESLVQIAHRQGCDLRLPQRGRDAHRERHGTTPLLEFVTTCIELMVERGRRLSEPQRTKLARYLDLVGNHEPDALIKALERARATILQEVPYSSLLP